MRTRADGSGPPSAAVLSILFALGEQSLHGYAIMKEVEERTDGRVSLLPSSLYATLKRMRDEGLIEEADGSVDSGPGRPRRSYRMTAEGRALAAREAERLSAMLDLASASGLASDPPPAVDASR